MKKQKKESKKKKSHIVFQGNRTVIHASREAIGAMKYKGE